MTTTSKEYAQALFELSSEAERTEETLDGLNLIREELGKLGIEAARIRAVDKGALDCTLKARVECAVYRSVSQTTELPWGGAIK